MLSASWLSERLFLSVLQRCTSVEVQYARAYVRMSTQDTHRNCSKVANGPSLPSVKFSDINAREALDANQSRSVPMRVMHVRHMRMPVPQTDMPMTMGMRLAGRIVRAVRMAMMNIVHMHMDVLQRLMCMIVFMHLRQMQPDADPHQETRDQQLKRDRLMQKDQRGHRTDEGSRGKIGPRASRPQIAKRQNK